MRDAPARDGPSRTLPRKTIAAWSQRRRTALLRLYADPRIDAGALAEASGIDAARAEALFAHLGAPPRGLRTAGLLRDPADTRALTARLRGHIGRQIDAFDAALDGTGAAVLDSARVLRDLGGLKRLLDALARDGDEARDGEGDGGKPDLPALRAEIARRAQSFVGAGEPP